MAVFLCWPFFEEFSTNSQLSNILKWKTNYFSNGFQLNEGFYSEKQFLTIFYFLSSKSLFWKTNCLGSIKSVFSLWFVSLVMICMPEALWIIISRLFRARASGRKELCQNVEVVYSSHRELLLLTSSSWSHYLRKISYTSIHISHLSISPWFPPFVTYPL